MTAVFRPLCAPLRRGFPLREKVSLARRFCAAAAVFGLSARFCAAVSLCAGKFLRPALSRACGRFRPLRAPLRRICPLRGKFPRPALLRACGRFRPLRASLRRVVHLRGKVFLRPALSRACGRFRPLRAFLRRVVHLRGKVFLRPALSHACGRFRPLCASLRRVVHLRGNFPARRFRAPAAGSRPSAPLCAALSVCAGKFPRPALARVCGRFRPLCASLRRVVHLRGNFFPARHSRAPAAVSGLLSVKHSALSLCSGNGVSFFF